MLKYKIPQIVTLTREAYKTSLKLLVELVKRGNVFFIVLYLDGVGHLMRRLIHD